MKKLVVSVALALAGVFLFGLQTSQSHATEVLIGTAALWGLALSLLMTALSERKRRKRRIPVE